MDSYAHLPKVMQCHSAPKHQLPPPPGGISHRSKGGHAHRRSHIKAICDKFSNYRRNILFRFTVGSADNQTLKFWDGNAPSFDERLESLMHACNAGFQTSVSGEPMLDDKVDILIDIIMPNVTDAIWLGKANNMMARLKMNGHCGQETMKRARQLLDSQSDEYILELYSRHKNNPKIKWKESIKKAVGIEVPTTSGLDI